MINRPARLAFVSTLLNSLHITRSCKTTTSTSMMKAALYEPGGPENLRVGDFPRPELRETDVMIKIHSTAINRADTLQRKGLYPAPKGESEILGLEAAGEISEIHPSCQTNYQIGDHVMALLPGGGNAEYARAHSKHIMNVPNGVSMLEAGGIPEVWLTACQILHFVGKLQPSERVLIHAGASGVGTSAIQLARLHGAIPYITAGSEEKINFCKELGAEAGFNYKEGDWAEGVMKATNGSGVHLVLDCVGGSYWKQNTQVLSMDGRWVLYGLMGGANVDGPMLGALLRKRIQLLSTTLRTRTNQYKSELVRSFTDTALPHFGTKLKPIIETSFPLSEISEAHKLMESNGTRGKILINVIDSQKHTEL